MKFNVNEINSHVKIADTDSMFICFEPVLKKLYPDLDLNDKLAVIPKLKLLQKEVGEKLNNYQSEIAKRISNCDEHYFSLKPEFLVQKAYISGVRRYAQYLVDREGMAIDKYVIAGIDIVKSNFPPYFKNFGEQLIKDILTGKPKTDIDKDVMIFKTSMDTVDWRLLVKPSGLKKIDEYIESAPLSGDMFSKLKLKCPINTKASIISNDLLRFYGLDKQYPCFTIGDKINTVLLKNNPYKIDVIGLNGFNDAPQILDIAKKYIDKDGLFVSIIRNKLENIYQDLGWSLSLNPHIDKFSLYEI